MGRSLGTPDGVGPEKGRNTKHIMLRGRGKSRIISGSKYGIVIDRKDKGRYIGCVVVYWPLLCGSGGLFGRCVSCTILIVDEGYVRRGHHRKPDLKLSSHNIDSFVFFLCSCVHFSLFLRIDHNDLDGVGLFLVVKIRQETVGVKAVIHNLFFPSIFILGFICIG